MRVKVATPEVNENGQNCCVNKKRAKLNSESDSWYYQSFQRQFFPFTSAFNCATTAKAKGKNGAVSLLLCLLKKTVIRSFIARTCFEHRKSRAIKRPAIMVLLWCYLGNFTPKKSFVKNNTNSDLFSGFVLFAYGGRKRFAIAPR